MTNDDDFATHLRERIAVIAPGVSVDTSAVVPRGRRRRRVAGLASVAATGVVLAGGAWVASAASDVNNPPAGEPSEQWTAPAWFAEQAAERASFRANLQECVDARGWQITVNEWGGSEHWFADEAEMDRFVADVDECSAALGRTGASGFVDDNDDDPDALTRYLYPMLVDTWECVVNRGYDVPPPPSEDELVRQYAPGSHEPVWTPYGDLSAGDGLMTAERMADLEITCPLPW